MNSKMIFLKKVNPKNEMIEAAPVRIKGKYMILAFMFLLAGSGFARAQENFGWGVKAGINASTQAELGNICDNNKLVAGFNGGLVARYGFNDWLGVRSGLDFQMKGTLCDKSGNEPDVTNRANYLLIPVKAEFSAGEKAGFKNGQRLFFATGPFAGYVLNAKQINGDAKTDLDFYNDFDYGWSFEIGYQISVMKSNVLQFSLNYDMGIADVAENVDSQNKSASLNISWLF